MPRKIVKGNTENLNILNSKIKYIGFELEKVPEFLKDFEPLNYRVPKVYDETTYKIYKYVKIKDIEILITPKDRLDELSERYKLASPLFTYMKPETNEDIEKYAYFLKMINQTNVLDIENIEKEQKEFDKEIAHREDEVEKEFLQAEKANYLMKNKKYADALVIYNSLIASYLKGNDNAYAPNEVYFYRGKARQLTGDVIGAQSDFIMTKKMCPSCVFDLETNLVNKP